jgi:hypothetical protein
VKKVVGRLAGISRQSWVVGKHVVVILVVSLAGFAEALDPRAFAD